MNFCEIDVVKIEKEKAMIRYRRFQKIAKIARTFEFCFAFVFLSWSISRSTTYFPVVVELTGFFLRRFYTLVLSHHFVFLLGNLIIFTLFLKFRYSVSSSDANADDDLLIPRFVSYCEVPSVEQPSNDQLVAEIDECVVQSIDRGARRNRRSKSFFSASASTENADDDEEVSDGFVVHRRIQSTRRSRRSKSQEFELDATEKNHFKRSETEPRRKLDISEVKSTTAKRTDVEDLSNEEFQLKVEAFIEKQQRFLREESMVMLN